jgi:hypothetical protein
MLRFMLSVLNHPQIGAELLDQRARELMMSDCQRRGVAADKTSSIKAPVVTCSLIRRGQGKDVHRLNRWAAGAAVVVLSFGSAPASAATRRDRLLTVLGASIADVVCFASSDLTTKNPATTPAEQFAARAAALCLRTAS